jgi:hypothetical protein
MRVVWTNAWPPSAGPVGEGEGEGPAGAAEGPVAAGEGTLFAAPASSLDRTADNSTAYCRAWAGLGSPAVRRTEIMK